MRTLVAILLLLVPTMPAFGQGEDAFSFDTLVEQLRQPLAAEARAQGVDVSGSEGVWFSDPTEVIYGKGTLQAGENDYPMELFVYSQAGKVEAIKLTYLAKAEDMPVSFEMQQALWDGLKDHLVARFGLEEATLNEPAYGERRYEYWDQSDNFVLLTWVVDGGLTLWVETRDFSLDLSEAQASYDSYYYEDEDW